MASSALPRAGVRPALPSLRMPSVRVRWKIMAPFILLTVVVALVGSYLATGLVTGSVEERFTNQLITASRSAADATVRRERDQLAIVRGVSFTEGMAAAVRERDHATVARLVEPLIANGHGERVELLDASGTQLFGERLAANGAGFEAVAPSDYRTWGIVDDSLAGRADAYGDKWVQFVHTPDGVVLYTAGPLLDGGGVAGVVLVGTPIGAFLAGARQDSFADISLLDPRGELIGSTLEPDTPASMSPAGPLPAPGAAALRERRSVNGRDFEVLYAPLQLRNDFVGYEAVALPSEYVAAPGSRAAWQMTLLFGLMMLAVLAIGWLVAHRLTSPLLRVVGAARAVSRGDLTARSHVAASDEIGVLASAFDEMAERLQRLHLATIGALASAIDARDPYTAGHSTRVGELSVRLGTELGLKAEALYHLRVGGLLHDVGKIGVRDNVLLKGGKLTARERALIEEHPAIGLRILAPAELPREVLAIVGGHHERLDGSGYPLRLSQDELAIFPRIAAVADVYDALTTSRPYRTAMSRDEALAILAREADGRTMDPDVVATMRRIAAAWDEYRACVPETLPSLLGPAAALAVTP